MVRRPLLLLALLAGLAALPAGTVARAGDAKPARGDATRGRKVYLRNCVVCHFADGSGGKKITPNGNPSRDLREPGFWKERTDDQVRKVIREGIPKSGMIPWDGILTDRDIEDVIVYMKTLVRKPAADSTRGAADSTRAGPATADDKP